MIDIKQLQQQKSELQQVWEYLGIDSKFPDKQVRQWLLEYSTEEIEKAFRIMAVREKDVQDAAAYVGKILHNAKLQNMTVEEREAKVSALRSLAGSIGARKKHEAELAAIRKEYAASVATPPTKSDPPSDKFVGGQSAAKSDATQVAKDLPKVSQNFARNLPEVCRPFASEVGVGVEVEVEGVAVAVAVGEYDNDTDAAAPRRVVARAPKPEENTNTKTNGNTKTKSVRRCKVCGEELSRSVNHKCLSENITLGFDDEADIANKETKTTATPTATPKTNGSSALSAKPADCSECGIEAMLDLQGGWFHEHDRSCSIGVKAREAREKADRIAADFRARRAAQSKPNGGVGRYL